MYRTCKSLVCVPLLSVRKFVCGHVYKRHLWCHVFVIPVHCFKVERCLDDNETLHLGAYPENTTLATSTTSRSHRCRPRKPGSYNWSASPCRKSAQNPRLQDEQLDQAPLLDLEEELVYCCADNKRMKVRVVQMKQLYAQLL